MSFEIFNEHSVKEECREMFLALNSSKREVSYAISDLPIESIQESINHYPANIKVRRLKGSKVKVWIPEVIPPTKEPNN